MLRLLKNLFGKMKNSSPQSSMEGKKEDVLEKPKYDVLIAVYDNPGLPPKVVQLSAEDYVELINNLSNKTYNFSQEKGGSIPYIVIREIVENLIHANFNEAVVTILDEGNTIRVADQGPGIPDKDRVFLPGFSTATSFHKHYIRGVGSGLPIIKESISYLGGNLSIEDNLNKGAVITLSIPNHRSDSPHTHVKTDKDSHFIDKQSKMPCKEESKPVYSESQNQQKKFYLSERQKKIILLLAEYEELGPSTVTKELNISLSTAYRELVFLEKNSLLRSIDNGKRVLTQEGIDCLNYIFE